MEVGDFDFFPNLIFAKIKNTPRPSYRPLEFQFDEKVKSQKIPQELLV